MKKIVLFMLFACSICCNAQDYLIVHLKDGSSRKYYLETVDSVSFGSDSKSDTTKTDVQGDEHECVDLGLSIRWATCNVGATYPEDYGLYFAWGETTGYTCNSSEDHSFDWVDYKWCNGSSSTITKYYSGDGLTVLESCDDAATVNWGSEWRMPTKEELKELQSNCTWAWTTLNGAKGYTVTGTNGNFIFLPAAGMCYRYMVIDDRSSCYYWSSTLPSRCPGDEGAYSLIVNPSIEDADILRFAGLTVRAVCP